jgi:MOSC domain-containing protein YiiM
MIKIESINTSQTTRIPSAQGEVLTGIYKLPQAGVAQVTPYGITNDAIVDTSVHGGIDQAIYVYLLEDYQWWAEQLEQALEFGTFGENLTISGCAELDFKVGDRLKVQGLEFEVSAPRVPCFKLGYRMGNQGFVKKFVQAVRPGFYLRVIQGGELHSGAELIYHPTGKDYISIKDVFVEWHRRDKSKAVLQKGLQSPLARVHKGRFQEWLDEA